MQVELNPMAKKIRSSLMFRFLETAKELERQGQKIIHLEKGEPEMGPPKGAIEAAKKAMDEGHNILTPSQGIAELRDAIAEDLRSEYGFRVDPSKEIAVVPGAKFGVFAAFASVMMPGDEVLCISPFFPPQREIVEMAGGTFVPVPILEQGRCGLTRGSLEKRLTSKTRFLLLNYPHNPTGWVPTEEEFDLLRDVVERRGIVVVSDEVYDKILFDGLKHRPFFGLPKLDGRLMLVNSFSKRFAMTGWRIGYCVGPAGWIQGVLRIQQNTTTCTHSVSQKAAAAALRREAAFPRMLARIYEERRNLFIKKVEAIQGLEPIIPKGTFFVFVSISKLSIGSVQFAEELLSEEQVALTPGAAFGEEWDRYIRFSMTEEPEKIAAALERLKRFVERRI